MGVLEQAPDPAARSDGTWLRSAWWQWLAALAAVAFVTRLAIRREAAFPYPLDIVGGWSAIVPLLRVTGWTAIRVWTFWILSTAIVGGLLRRVDQSIETSDALIAGAAGVWVVAYIAGNLLGPIELWNSLTIWILLAAGAAALAKRPFPFSLAEPSTGQKLALLAWAMLSFSLLALQLGSPVPPYMDVLNHPAAVQRIVTFGRYLPFDNDPYGAYGAHVQAPALELFYATLAFGSRTHLATLAVTAAMVPMAGLMMFAAYRLGRALFGDTAGGMAALLLFFTCLLRREQGMRATAVVFALVTIGLAFMIELPRNRILFALGAVMLGTAVASHALGGGFAIITAAGIGLTWFAAEDIAGAEAMVICLTGAAVFALPEILIAERYRVSYPLLPLAIIAGIAIILFGASRLRESFLRESKVPRYFTASLTAILLELIFYRHLEHRSMFDTLAPQMPILAACALIGMIAAAVIGFREDGVMPNASAIAVALMIGVVAEFANDWLDPIVQSPIPRHMLQEVMSKMADYWVPYFLIFPAGLIFALLYERLSKPLAFFVVMTILIFPWFEAPNPQDYDGNEHAIVDQWAFNFARARDGYWGGAGDSRWALDADGIALVAKFNSELRAGRITPATHILHLTPSTSAWDLAQIAVFTGIDDDPIDYHYDPHNLFQAGSRVRGVAALPEAMAQRPPYVLEQGPPPAGFVVPPPGYEEIFNQGEFQLFRLKELPSRGVN